MSVQHRDDSPGSDRVQGFVRPDVAAVVVAAGSGSRMGGGEPKALRLLGGQPLVAHAVRTLRSAGVGPVVVVAPADRLADFATALEAEDAELVPGGAERQHSVLAGLYRLTGRPRRPRWVLVHDAARPLVPTGVVERVVDALAAGAPAVVPVVPVTDTVRILHAGGSEALNRADLRAVQTPQGFELSLLLAAHEALGDVAVTDDAAVCERAGHPVVLVDGSAESLKITRAVDLLVAEALLLQRAAEVTG